MRTKGSMTLLLALALIAPSETLRAEGPDRPNLIFIMVDDMGKGPVGCYGDAAADSLTPNIDRLAATGMRFDNFYSMPQCVPSRLALLTGEYPFRNGWVNHYDVPRWNLKGFNPQRYASFGNVMKSAGYATCIAGKWQISDFRREPKILNKCGFDEFCVWTGAESGNQPSFKRYWDAYLHTSDGSQTFRGKFGPDVCNEFLADFVRNHKDGPFFVYYPMILIHGPLEETPFERAGKRRVKKAEPTGKQPARKGKKRKRRDKSESIYYMDHLVGKLVKVLEATGIREKTVIVWTTDNGPRKGKTVEEGVCEPFVVSCPGVVPTGVVTDALVDVTDILPTFAELGGAALPQGRVFDGKSFAALISGKAKDSPREWIMAMGGSACLREESAAEPVEGRNKHEYRDRVIRDKSYKLYVDSHRKPVKLVRIIDGLEGENIIDSDNPRDKAALRKLSEVAAEFPQKDASPRY